MSDTFSGQRANPRFRSFVIGALAVSLAGLLTAANLKTGWIPHDEGQFGQAAERVLHGELPHRDFDDMYTGGLSFLNAVSFHMWGVKSESMRWMLWVFFVPFIATVYWLIQRITTAPIAALLTVLCASLSLPIYSAPMPSWYNLFFATWGVAALIKLIETNQIRYAVLAGLCGGCSILFKIIGLYFVAAGLLFLLYRSQHRFAGSTTQSRSFSLLVSVAVALFAMLSCVFFGDFDPLMTSIHFVIPFLVLCGLVLHNEWTGANGGFGQRLVDVARSAAAFSAGVAIPIAAYVAFYAAHGSLGELAHGVLVMPRMRSESAVWPLPAWSVFVTAIPLAMIICYGLASRKNIDNSVAKWIAILGISILLASATRFGFSIGFYSIRNLMPLTVLGVAILLFNACHFRVGGTDRQQLFLVACVAFFVSLVQFPYAYDIYFFYCAPLLILAVVYFVNYQPYRLQRSLVTLAGFFLLFSIARLHTIDPNYNVHWPDGRLVAAQLDTDRCGLIVNQQEAEPFNQLIGAIERHSKPGDYIYATPDIPDACFMTGRRSINGVMYEFFRPGVAADIEGLIEKLREKNVNLVVINSRPSFSGRISESLQSALEAEYPKHRVILSSDRAIGDLVERYRVLWRD